VIANTKFGRDSRGGTQTSGRGKVRWLDDFSTTHKKFQTMIYHQIFNIGLILVLKGALSAGELTQRLIASTDVCPESEPDEIFSLLATSCERNL
jgi:hypothetical protein